MSLDSTRYRARAEGTDWLYDCHRQRFAELGGGATASTGFAPLFLSQLFGVPIARWPEAVQEATQVSREAPRFAELLRHRRPKRSLASAAEIALLVYPAMERFVERTGGERGPFQLRERFLFQPNVPLGPIQRRGSEGWADLQGDMPVCGGMRPDAPDGVYVVGHSGLLVRGGRSGLLIDPVPLSPLAAEGAIEIERLARNADSIAITHGHFDHYHLPSLLALGSRPVVVPRVPRASIVCEDLAARLLDHGLAACDPEWGSSRSAGDLHLHVLPFVGEQFLTSEEHPEARNWGNAYAVRSGSMCTFVAADCGFEPGRSVFDVARRFVEESGPVQVLAAQAIGLRSTFGLGDADLQLIALTCAHRAEEAFELLHRDRRVTLDARDVAELCRILGASTVVLYGQFQFVEGEPCVAPELVERVRGELARMGLDDVRVPALRVGEGVGPAGPVRL